MRALKTLVGGSVLALSFACGGVAVAAPAADTTPPTTPTNLRVTATTNTTVSLAWNPSTDNSGNLTYILADNFGQTTYHRKGETTAQRSWLSPQHTYTYTIQAVDYSGNRSGVSNSVSYTTPPDVTPPTAPTLTVSQVAPARLTAQWTQSLDDTTFFVFYTLLVDGSPHAGDLVQGRVQTVLNLTPSTTYTLRVTARDPYGNTSQSNTVSATTPPRTDTVPPTAPANLRGRDGGTCETYMSFDLSTDNADTQSNLVYRMYVNGLLAPRSMVRAVGRTTVFQQSLVPGVNSFVVEALDSSGNVSTPSNEFLLNATGC